MKTGKTNVYAGVVLYNPEIERLMANIDAIYSQVDYVVLVDNGSNNIEQVREFLSNYERINIIDYKVNLGIAKALNEIMRDGLRKGYEWGLTLDQDSIVSDDIIERYQSYIRTHDCCQIGCLTCKITDRNFTLTEDINSDVECRELDYCITSGSLMNINAVFRVGAFDEKMFIDKVDTDICINLRKHGYKVMQLNFEGLLHEVGHAKQVSLGIRKWELYNHNAKRRYYMCRNASYLLKKYHDVYVWKVFLKEIFHTVLVLIYEDEKKIKFKAGLKGFMEGFSVKST